LYRYGSAGSITEDTYFALLIAEHGVRFKWVHGTMHEQSPFTITDFMKQRCRWFSGLWLCVVCPDLALWRRVVLGSFVVSWGFSPLLALFMWLNLATDAFDQIGTMGTIVKTLHGLVLWGYLLGFVLNFSTKTFRHGAAEYLSHMLMMVVAIPFFGAMEAGGVFLALIKHQEGGFHVVKKEGAAVAAASNTLAGRRREGGGGDDAEKGGAGGAYHDADDADAAADKESARARAGVAELVAKGRDGRIDYWRRELETCAETVDKARMDEAFDVQGGGGDGDGGGEELNPVRRVVELSAVAVDALGAVADRCGAPAQDVALALFARLAALLAGLDDKAAAVGVLQSEVALDAAGETVVRGQTPICIPAPAAQHVTMSALAEQASEARERAADNAIPLPAILAAAGLSPPGHASANDGSPLASDAAAARVDEEADGTAPMALAVVVHNHNRGGGEKAEEAFGGPSLANDGAFAFDSSSSSSAMAWVDTTSRSPPPALLEMHVMLSTPPPSLSHSSVTGYQTAAAAADQRVDDKAVARVALAAPSDKASESLLARWAALLEGAVFEVLDGMGGRSLDGGAGAGGGGRGGGARDVRRHEAPAPTFLSSADRARLLYVFNNTAPPPPPPPPPAPASQQPPQSPSSRGGVTQPPPPPPPQSMDRRLELAAAAHPEAPALLYETEGGGDASSASVSYAQLLAASSSVAVALRAAAAERMGQSRSSSGDDGTSSSAWTVAIVMESSPAMVACVMGAVRSGAAYVPIHPASLPDPAARVEAVVRETGAKVAVTEQRWLRDHRVGAALERCGVSVFVPSPRGLAFGIVPAADAAAATATDDSSAAALVVQPDDARLSSPRWLQVASPASAAYVVYTSGATGSRDKGVVVGHRELCIRTSWLQRSYPMTPGVDRCILKTPLTSRASQWELFWTLSSGAGLVIPGAATPHQHQQRPRRDRDDAPTLIRLIRRFNVTHACLTPSQLGVFVDVDESRMLEAAAAAASAAGGVPSSWNPGDGWANAALLHIIVCGGGGGQQAFTAAHVERFAQCGSPALLHHAYSPLGGSMTAWTCPRLRSGASLPWGGHVLAGKPVDNTAVYIVRPGSAIAAGGRSKMDLVPIGVPGEVVFGRCVAHGYVGEESSADFVLDPFPEAAAAAGRPALVYRTGDIGQWDEFGNLKLLPRRVGGTRGSAQPLSSAAPPPPHPPSRRRRRLSSGFDSLGIPVSASVLGGTAPVSRSASSSSSASPPSALERVVSDVMRGVMIYGVVVDHMWGCEGLYCRAVVASVDGAALAAAAPGDGRLVALRTLERLVRSVGGAVQVECSCDP
jgi:non-ribosomal peptide synthetase component F